MAETGRRDPRAWPPLLALGLLIVVALGAPLLASERPLIARVDGRLALPACADLPLVGRLFDRPALHVVDWGRPGEGVAVLLRAPVPYSYRGIHLQEALVAPSRRHLLGTDSLGRDLLARLIHGSRPSLLVGLLATALALLAGGALGTLAGLNRGFLDLAVVRLADTVACFPPFVLALAFVATGHGGLTPIVLGIAATRWTGTARYVRGEILRQRGGDLWAAARASGATLPRVALRHLLPALLPALAVTSAFGVAHAIVLESGLSFLGLGVAPPTPSWGAILAESRLSLDAAWWPVAFPTLTLLLVLSILCLAAETASAARGPDGTLS